MLTILDTRTASRPAGMAVNANEPFALVEWRRKNFKWRLSLIGRYATKSQAQAAMRSAAWHYSKG